MDAERVKKLKAGHYSPHPVRSPNKARLFVWSSQNPGQSPLSSVGDKKAPDELPENHFIVEKILDHRKRGVSVSVLVHCPAVCPAALLGLVSLQTMDGVSSPSCLVVGSALRAELRERSGVPAQRPLNQLCLLP